MRIALYIRCLAAYNCGIEHGKWIYPGDYADGEGVHNAIKALLASSPAPGAEEYRIDDAEGLRTELANSLTFDQWVKYAELAKEYGKAYIAWADDQLTGYPIVLDDGEAFQNAYQGEFTSWANVARDLMESAGMLKEMPEHLRGYFDYEAYGEDIRHDYWKADGFYFSCS